MHKLGLRIVAEVVVSEERILTQLVRNLVPVFLQRLLVQMVADADRSRYDKVHL